MKSEDIRRRFLDFFRVRGHTAVPSSSLIPDDPSVLLTTAGMQQFKKYYVGEADPVHDFGSPNTASCQKSFRTSDIDEVGDERHLTFFEMLGNFSFGGYGKREAIQYAYEYITKEMNVPISYVTIFKGSAVVPRDEESASIWAKLGITDIREEGMEDVFWGPTGSAGPCGPTTEIYIKNAAGQDIEIWNIVFNQFFYPGTREELLAGISEKKLTPLKQFGVDTGMGLERLAMVVQKTKTIFETDIFASFMALIPSDIAMRRKRIIVDHVRGACFLIADGVRPSNKGAGYTLRRLLRRIITCIYKTNTIADIDVVVEAVVTKYSGVKDYGNLKADIIKNVLHEEYALFNKTVGSVITITEKTLRPFQVAQGGSGRIDASTIFNLHQSTGVTVDISKDIANEMGLVFNQEEVEEYMKKHREISRAGVEKKFGGHGLLLDTGELKAGNEKELQKVTRLHTATHLLQQALRDVLGGGVEQRGSDITVERTRFDFSFPRKMTKEEIKKVEEIVNQKIKEDHQVSFKEMPLEEAKKTGALHYFSAKGGSTPEGKEKYPNQVKVYYVGSSLTSAYSKEFCGGPHVSHTSEIGHFKILKEEAVSLGIRRLRAIVE